MEQKTERQLKEKVLFHFGQLFEFTVLDAYNNESKELFVVELEAKDDDDFFKIDKEKQHTIKVSFSYEERGSNVIIQNYRVVKGFLMDSRHLVSCNLFRGYTAKNNIFVDANNVFEKNKDAEFALFMVRKKLFYNEDQPNFGDEPVNNDGKPGSDETVIAKHLRSLISFESLKQYLYFFEQSDWDRIIESSVKVVVEMNEEIDDSDYLRIADFFTIWHTPTNKEIIHYVFEKDNKK